MINESPGLTYEQMRKNVRKTATVSRNVKVVLYEILNRLEALEDGDKEIKVPQVKTQDPLAKARAAKIAKAKARAEAQKGVAL